MTSAAPAASLAQPSTDPDVLLDIDGLRMSFGDKEVLKGLSFQVRRGEIFGFIGPNGAGKTTTIRILATLLHPSAGNVWFEGVHVVERPDVIRRRIGYMPDYVGVYPGLTVVEYLEFFAGAYRIRGRQRRALLADVLELTDLTRLVDVEVQVLSKGMRQRLCLAQTLIHDPDLLILDEPASGLDPRARIEFRALLQELRRMGKTIFLSSHILTELSPICDSVGIIEAGELVTSGRVRDILEMMHREAPIYRVQLVQPLATSATDAAANPESPIGATPAPAAGEPETAGAVEDDRAPFEARCRAVLAALAADPDVAEARLDEDGIRFRYLGDEQRLHRIFGHFVSAGLAFNGVDKEEGDLETIFMRFTRGEVS